jgi:hypothetical protein
MRQEYGLFCPIRNLSRPTDNNDPRYLACTTTYRLQNRLKSGCHRRKRPLRSCCLFDLERCASNGSPDRVVVGRSAHADRAS